MANFKKVVILDAVVFFGKAQFNRICSQSLLKSNLHNFLLLKPPNYLNHIAK